MNTSNSLSVTFQYSKKPIEGSLSLVMGMGGSGVYHLMVDGKYWGQLSYHTGHPGFNGLHAVPAGWRFNGKDKALGELAEVLGKAVEEAK